MKTARETWEVLRSLQKYDDKSDPNEWQAGDLLTHSLNPAKPDGETLLNGGIEARMNTVFNWVKEEGLYLIFTYRHGEKKEHFMLNDCPFYQYYYIRLDVDRMKEDGFV